MASRIPYAPLNEKQAKYIRDCADSWLNVAEGGKRAGKNIINLLAWAGCLENHPDRLHLAGRGQPGKRQDEHPGQQRLRPAQPV